MSRKRLTTWVMIVAVSMTARIAVAAPRTAMTELRAAVCCMEHCPEGARPPMRPHRCCAVSSDATDPVSTTVVASLERPDAVPLAVLPPATPVVGRLRLAVTTDLVASRASPPGFLETQKLRC